MQFDYRPAVAIISGQALSIIGTVSATLVGGTITASVSGQRVYLANDGINNVVKISGQSVSIVGAVTVNIPNDSINNVVKTSGQTAYLPNDGVNNVVKISGQTVYLAGTTMKTNAMVTVIGTSGGTQLPNLSCVKAYVRSVSGNDVMFVGGTGAQAPFSGTGLELYGGEVLPIEIDNTNKIQIMGATANQKVSIMVVA